MERFTEGESTREEKKTSSVRTLTVRLFGKT